MRREVGKMGGEGVSGCVWCVSERVVCTCLGVQSVCEGVGGPGTAGEPGAHDPAPTTPSADQRRVDSRLCG